MTTVTRPQGSPPSAPAPDPPGPQSGHSSGLRITAYDQVASLLIAALVLVGFTFVMLFIIWLTTVLSFTPKSVPVEFIEYEGRGDHAEGFERDLEPPGLEELEEVKEPSLEATIEAVTDLVSTQSASLDALNTDVQITGKGSGMGDSRRPGPLGEGQNVIPPWERWEIRFSTTNRATYASQLDSFGIELGAAGGSELVDYASNLSRPQPTTRQGPSADEKRIYMTWKSGKLREFDIQLLQKAGIQTGGRIIMQFYSKELVQQMEALEFQFSSPRPPEEWQKTIFGVRSAGGGYEFYVIDMFYRVAPPE